MFVKKNKDSILANNLTRQIQLENDCSQLVLSDWVDDSINETTNPVRNQNSKFLIKYSILIWNLTLITMQQLCPLYTTFN